MVELGVLRDEEVVLGVSYDVLLKLAFESPIVTHVLRRVDDLAKATCHSLIHGRATSSHSLVLLLSHIDGLVGVVGSIIREVRSGKSLLGSQNHPSSVSRRCVDC